MSKRLAMFGVVTFLGGVVIGTGVAAACGDKFVVLGRGARFAAIHAAKRPASILIYSGPGSRMPAAEKEYRLESTLRMAGHKSAFIRDPEDLEKALASRKYDLVLADLTDAASLEKKTQTASSNVTIIPVVYNPTGAELAEAERQYSCLVKASSKKSTDLLAVIDETMLARSKGTGVNCAKPR